MTTLRSSELNEKGYTNPITEGPVRKQPATPPARCLPVTQHYHFRFMNQLGLPTLSFSTASIEKSAAGRS